LNHGCAASERDELLAHHACRTENPDFDRCLRPRVLFVSVPTSFVRFVIAFVIQKKADAVVNRSAAGRSIENWYSALEHTHSTRRPAYGERFRLSEVKRMRQAV
jgi:hypothetical protein